MATASMMRAAVTEAWRHLRVREVPVPEPGPGQVRIRTRLAGICGSDIHIFQGHHPTAQAPIVQGHEFVGELDRAGPDTAVDAAPGQRVVVEPLLSCGACEACRRGYVHVCRQLRLLGIHEDGAFAQYLLAPAAKVIAVPDALPDRLAVLAEPFAVGVHVCQRAMLEPGARVLVIGAGPIGLIVAIVAACCGTRVAVSEVSPRRLALAASLGFETVDGNGDALGRVRALTGGDGFDVCIEVAGVEPALQLAIEAARVRGAIVQVGFHTRPPAADLFKLCLRELSLVGSRVYTNEDFRRSLRLLDQLARDGRFPLASLISEQVGLSGIEAAIARMMVGEVTGKILVDPGADGSQTAHARESA